MLNIKISLSSVLMAVVCSGILTGMLSWMRKKKVVVNGYGIFGILLMFVLCIARLLIPLDFPFTRAVSWKGVYAALYDWLWFRRYPIGSWRVCMLDIACLIWFAVAAVRLILFLLEYRSMCRLHAQLCVRDDEQCRRILQSVYEKTGKERNVEILHHPNILMPKGAGLRKRRILLQEREYEDQELFYILMHEYTHLIHGDLNIKMASVCFCCIFWWNPFAYMLDREVEQCLEMRCDLSVTKLLSSRETVEYLETIIKIMKDPGDSGRFGGSNMLSLGKNVKSEIGERFQFILNSRKNNNRVTWYMFLMVSVFILVWVLSYSVLPIAGYDPPEKEVATDSDAYEVTPDNSYIVYKDGKYYFHIDSETGEAMENEIPLETLEWYLERGFKIRED